MAQGRAPVHILDYSVDASLDYANAQISGTASVWLHITSDSLNSFSFRVPKKMDINAVRDIDDDPFPKHRIVREQQSYLHILEFASFRYRGDSFFVKIEFDEKVDSASDSKMFFNSREFILPYTPTAAWLPDFQSIETEKASLEISVPFPYNIISSASIEPMQTAEDQYRWKLSYDSEVSLTEAFSLCGSVTTSELKKISNDSLTSISFVSTTNTFEKRFADSLSSTVIDASRFFKQLKGTDTLPSMMQYIIIGDDPFHNEAIRMGSSVIFRNSPAYSYFDSTTFIRKKNNPWLVELARTFCPKTNDTTLLFTDGWAGYLTFRYLLSESKNSSYEKRERLDLMIKALSFYPVQSLASGQNSEREILSARATYFFLMLEYVIGRESFVKVIKKMYIQFSNQEMTRKDFQLLCEEEYGSSLEWFFNQWINRSSVPEFVVHWTAENTLRGITVVKVMIEQRGEVFSMPINLFFGVGTKSIPKRIFVEQAKHEFSFQFSMPPHQVELDPDFSVLRWILDIRILAHTRSSIQFLTFNKDLSSSQREALLTLQLDPTNATGTAPMACFTLGKIAVLENDLERAKEYFLKSMQSSVVEESQLYPLLSLVRYANVLEMEGKRDEALLLYQRAIAEGKNNPSVFASVIFEAEKYLRQYFVSNDELWYGKY